MVKNAGNKKVKLFENCCKGLKMDDLIKDRNVQFYNSELFALYVCFDVLLNNPLTKDCLLAVSDQGVVFKMENLQYQTRGVVLTQIGKVKKKPKSPL